MTQAAYVSAVILAGGLSSRMGGAHKLLLDIGGESMLRRVVRAVLAVGPAEVVVVTGHRAPEIRAALDDLAVRFAHNPVFAEGQPGSVVTGVRALSAICQAVMIVLGDQPMLTPDSLRHVIAAYAAMPAGRSILVPTWKGQRGNPVLFASHHIPAIRAGDLKLGCRRLIESYPDEVALVAMADDAFVRDCDTPADYQAVRRQLGFEPVEV
ncbi:nucleotidyltransferase family protein [Acidisoma cellulosilytica]|uniref:Nucleotidyltransferase family protein n=1 Tax=Acidisoma cellulosilyticum TaxID=2802395 RepID=A0A963Z5F2_9PROT|nr:nucleotidyltransferase family protein [Acidisoma cellulosilyticum]MCB8883132.1 nucleotidyltransferase family protein [Acidisoma cellulosilyticum]